MNMSAFYDKHVGELKATNTEPSWAETCQTHMESSWVFSQDLCILLVFNLDD